MPTQKPPQPDSLTVEYVPLEVTAGILIHIGAGIYHSVAGALKELVTNAYDADARTVVVSTDYPKFNEFRIVDTGAGMTATRFKQAMRSIGTSLKGVFDPDRKTKRLKRPVIGQLGIGFMALSQVCSKAVIESQVEGSSTKFVAHLDFSEFKRRRYDELRLDVFRERIEKYGGIASLKTQLKDADTDEERRLEIKEILDLLKTANPAVLEPSESDREHLGYCVIYPNLPAVPGQFGTTITLSDIDPAVKDSLLDVGRAEDELQKHFGNESLNWESYRNEVDQWGWSELCTRLRQSTNGLTFQWLPKYHQFLWELALMTPVQYVDGGPVTIATGVLKQKKKELDNYDFTLVVDDHRLQKPVLLPSGGLREDIEPGYDYTLEEFEYNGIVDHERLKYSGYIFWQRKQIQPSTVRGIEIYIRNVGIGQYDDTVLNFSTVNPTSRAAQMSGEVYVEAGLERALNVNRNSFRETDAHYVHLQQHLWNLLGTTTKDDGVIGRSVTAYWSRKERANDELVFEQRDYLRSIADSLTEGKVPVTFSQASNDEPYELRDGKLVVFEKSPAWPRPIKERHAAQRTLVAAFLAIESGFTRAELLSLLKSLILRR